MQQILEFAERFYRPIANVQGWAELFGKPLSAVLCSIKMLVFLFFCEQSFMS
jgi:hypothetical protein